MNTSMTGIDLSRLPELDPPSGPEWLKRKSRSAMERYRRNGLPTRKSEAWRYTSLEPILARQYLPAPEPPDLSQIDRLHPFFLPQQDRARLVFINGRFTPRFSRLPGGENSQGATIGSLASAMEEHPGLLAERLDLDRGEADRAFQDLNTGLMQDGLFLHLHSGSERIELLMVSLPGISPQLLQPRHLILLDRDSECDLIEQHVSLGDPENFSNSLMEIHLGKAARLTHQRLLREEASSHHLSGTRVRMAQQSDYRCTTAALGGDWSRTEIDVSFTGEDASCRLEGLYMAGDRQLNDIHLNVEHRKPGCTSQENFKGIVDGKGRAVFDGRISVHPKAQKSDAHLSNANLMLSKQGEVDTKPQLEILADDVKCSHGTSIGQLDPEMLFYLRSRGIPEPQARQLLCLGFAGEILGAFQDPWLRQCIERLIEQRLAGSGIPDLERH